MSGRRAGSQIRDRIVGLRRVRADELLPNPKNWRRHPKAQAEALRGLLGEIGYADALLARETPDGLMLIDGHLRAETTPDVEVPVLVLDLDEAEADKLLLTLDPLAAMAEMDGPATKALLEGVESESEAVQAVLAGLRDQAQKVIGPEEGLTDPDAVPEVVEPVAKRGDVWLCGDHRVMCGDSTDAEDVARLMAGEKADACITDPPYGIGVEYGKFDDSTSNVRELIDSVMPLLLEIPVVLLTPGVTEMWSYPRPRWLLAWIHPAPAASCPWGFTSVHPILAYGDDPYLARGLGGRPTAIVLHANREGVDGHPTPKPIAVWEWLVERGSPQAGERIYDPFLGSGTTMIAAERLGRRCYGMEIEPRYIDVAVRRWEEFTGRKAERERDRTKAKAHA